MHVGVGVVSVVSEVSGDVDGSIVSEASAIEGSAEALVAGVSDAVDTEELTALTATPAAEDVGVVLSSIVGEEDSDIEDAAVEVMVGVATALSDVVAATGNAVSVALVIAEAETGCADT